MTDIDMPMQLKDMLCFEKQNDISVSVCGWKPVKKNKDWKVEPGYVYTLRIAKKS